MNSNLIVIVCSAIILIVFLLHIIPLFRLLSLSIKIAKANNEEDLCKGIKKTKDINDSYNSTKNILVEGVLKTFYKAEEFYSQFEFAKVKGINLKAINAAPSILSGLGVLGTFVGLTISVLHFDSKNTETINASIQNLLGGMGTAFITSVIGMILSTFYIWIQKYIYNKYDKAISIFNRKLDLANYVSPEELTDRKTEEAFMELSNKLKALNDSNDKRNIALLNQITILSDKLDENKEFFNNALVSEDEEGNKIVPANMFLNFYEELEKQSQSLESFTTDLSNELNASLGKTMNISIVPLIQKLEESHNVMNSKIEELANNIQSPATDFVNTAVEELKQSMAKVAGDFKDSISSHTIGQLEMLASNLANTGEMLKTFPLMMQQMSEKVVDSFTNIQAIIGQLQTAVSNQQSEMLEQSKNTNASISRNIADQFKSMNESVDKMQSTITVQHEQMRESYRNLNNDLATHIKDSFASIMGQVETVMNKVNSQQNDLVNTHGRTTKEIEKLLTSFTESIIALKSVNSDNSQMLHSIQKAGENMNVSTEKMKEISANLNNAADDMMQQHKEIVSKFEELQSRSQLIINSLTSAVSDTESLMEDYIEQYETIKGGIKEIVAEMSNGLKEYSTTLRTSTGDALSEYSNALAKSTTGLQNIAEALTESAEELNDGLDKFKTMRR